MRIRDSRRPDSLPGDGKVLRVATPRENPPRQPVALGCGVAITGGFAPVVVGSVAG
jgi:hypothetical protein